MKKGSREVPSDYSVTTHLPSVPFQGQPYLPLWGLCPNSSLLKDRRDSLEDPPDGFRPYCSRRREGLNTGDTLFK